MSDRENRLGRLWQAIIDHTKGEDMFWLGEILLDELKKETGYSPAPDDARAGVDADPVGAFIRERVAVAPARSLSGVPSIHSIVSTSRAVLLVDSFVTAANMYAAFVAWCDRSAVRPMSARAFGHSMSGRGICKGIRRGLYCEAVRAYLYVSLIDDGVEIAPALLKPLAGGEGCEGCEGDGATLAKRKDERAQ